MGRPPKFSTDDLLDAAADLLLTGGPSALSAAAVARATGAPSGSVYHRFASRDHLAEALWMRTVERFDAEVVATLAGAGDPVEVAVTAAIRTVEWSAENPLDSYILTMFRRTDLVGAETVSDLADRAQSLGLRQRAAVDQLAERLDRPTDLVRFAVAGIAMAAIRGYLRDATPVPAWVSGAVERSVRAALSDDPDDLDDLDDLDEGDHR